MLHVLRNPETPLIFWYTTQTTIEHILLHPGVIINSASLQLPKYRLCSPCAYAHTVRIGLFKLYINRDTFSYGYTVDILYKHFSPKSKWIMAIYFFQVRLKVQESELFKFVFKHSSFLRLWSGSIWLLMWRSSPSRQNRLPKKVQIWILPC